MRGSRIGWVAAIVAAAGCGARVEMEAAAGGVAGTGGSGGAAGTTAATGGSGGASGGGDAGASPCQLGYSPPDAGCATLCVVGLPQGEDPAILYERPSPTAYDPVSVLAVTDDFVVVLASWGAATEDDPGDVWGVVEIPRAGGPPVTVDVFAPPATAYIEGYWADLVAGGDGYLYYSVEPIPFIDDPPSSWVNRISATQLGDQAVRVGSAPGTHWLTPPVVDGGFVYVYGDWGVARFPASGGATEAVTSAVPWGSCDPGGIAVKDGTVYGIFPTGPDSWALAEVPGAGGALVPRASGGGDMVFAGPAGSLFVDVGSAIARYDGFSGPPAMVLATPIDTFAGIAAQDDRVYAWVSCPDPHPDSGPGGGGFTLFYDTVSQETGFVEQQPAYPFVADPFDRFTRDASGTTLYYIE